MINSGRFTGLNWLDEDKTVFKVPWIHAKKRGYNMERDAALFREWAMHFGKYKENNDPTVWKINFRCAINGLKDIMEIKDMQTEDCRVYKVLPSRSKRRRPKVARQRAEPYPTSYATGAEGSSVSLTGVLPAHSQGLSGYHPLVSQHHTTGAPQEASSASSGQGEMEDRMVPFPSAYAIDDSEVMSCMISPPMDMVQDDTPPSSGLRIQIFYGSVTVHDEYLDCQNGNIIICHASTEDKQFQNIVLPDNHPHPQARDIFNGMQHGVLIEASDGNVYVTPLCRTVVYCGSSSTDLAQPLEKEVRSKVFDYRNHFRPALEHYALVHSQSPTPYVILGLGQNWGKDRPVSQNLVSITVTHIRSRFEFDAVELRFLLAQPTPAVSHGMKSAAIPDSTNFTGYSPPMTPNPATSDALPVFTDDTKVVNILSDLTDHPPPPPMSATPPSSQLQVRIFYGSIPVRTEYLDCKNGCRIFSSEDSLPPSSASSWQEDEKMTQFPEAKNIVLPDNHPQSCARDIFNAMRRGVLIEASDGNVYVTPLCRTVVYYGSSSTDLAQPLEKEVRSKVFDYRNHFRPALQNYARVHSQFPTPYVILGLGQNWGRGHHVTQNLISIVIVHAQARHEIDAIGLTHAVTQDLLIDLPDSGMVDQPNTFDAEAEAFLSVLGMCVDQPISTSSLPPRQSVHFREAEKRAVPFLFHHVLECDCSGQQYTIKDHDITLRVPRGAVAEGDVVHFEIGVAAYGPFRFPENTQPISPIVWLCLLEDTYELRKPFQLTVPHILSQISEERMQLHEATFAKASHSNHVVSKNVMSYKFNNCDIEPFFTSVCKQSYGALVSKHFCFYCLNAKQSAKLAVDAGYSLVRVETFLSPQRNEINFCTIYLLKTCLKSLEEQFPREEGCRITSCHDFKFSADSKIPHLEMIVPSEHDCCSIAMEPLAAKIRATDMDFWSMGVDKMQMKHDLKMYPPRVKMTVSMKCSDLAFKLPIKFNGCSDDSQLDTELTFPLGLPLSMRSTSSSSGSSSILYADSQSPTIKCGPPVLADAFRKLLSISTHWKNIGTLLSIPSSTLDRIERDEQDMHSRLREMLTQWFKADHQRSWTQLIDAVEPLDPSKAEELRKNVKDYPT